jgi:putative phosphoesterase
MKRVGVISDTHGLLRPEAAAFLRGSDFLIHAGDIGDAEILKTLAAIAPITAVRGNNDKGPWAASLIVRGGSVRAQITELEASTGHRYPHYPTPFPDRS